MVRASSNITIHYLSNAVTYNFKRKFGLTARRHPPPSTTQACHDITSPVSIASSEEVPIWTTPAEQSKKHSVLSSQIVQQKEATSLPLGPADPSSHLYSWKHFHNIQKAGEARAKSSDLVSALALAEVLARRLAKVFGHCDLSPVRCRICWALLGQWLVLHRACRESGGGSCPSRWIEDSSYAHFDARH